MSSERFDLYFRGELLDGYFADFVKVDMARLFKVDLARIEPYFSGEPQTIKLNVDRATAAKYQKALKAIGAKLLVVNQGTAIETKPAQPAADAAATHGQAATATTQAAPPEPARTSEGDWGLLPPGSDLGEHRDIQPVSVDVSGLSIAEVGVDLGEQSDKPPPVRVDISGLQLDEPGVDLIEADSSRPPPAPDTSHLKLEP